MYQITTFDDGELWNASISEVEENSTEQFDRIVSVCQDRCTDNVAGRIPYDHFMLADGVGSQQEHGGDCSYTMFEIAAENISEWVQNENVLVHCHAGRSRSVSICAAVLAVQNDGSFDEQLQYVIDQQDGRGNPNELLRSHGHRYVYDHQ
jgi:hypothetical protein